MHQIIACLATAFLLLGCATSQPKVEQPKRGDYFEVLNSAGEVMKIYAYPKEAQVMHALGLCVLLGGARISIKDSGTGQITLEQACLK